jgi:hypothetical protein
VRACVPGFFMHEEGRSMSKETLPHLNTNTLIGFTDNRGHAWHYRAEEQGDESNHYPGAIPIEDVQRRLFDWTAQSRRVAVELPADVESMTHLDDQGQSMRWAVVEDRQGICRSDTGSVMGGRTARRRCHRRTRGVPVGAGPDQIDRDGDPRDDPSDTVIALVGCHAPLTNASSTYSVRRKSAGGV